MRTLDIAAFKHGYLQKEAEVGPAGGKLMERAPYDVEKDAFRKKVQADRASRQAAPAQAPQMKAPEAPQAPAAAKAKPTSGKGLSASAGNAIQSNRAALLSALRQ